MANERALRVLSLPLTALATPFLIATTVISVETRQRVSWYHAYIPVTTFCFAYLPLALSALISLKSLHYHRKNGRLPGGLFTLLDWFATALYLGILIPIWALEVDWLYEPGDGLLVGYTTAPMIINMFMHLYIAICNARPIWSFLTCVTTHQCPNCHSKITVGGVSQANKTAKGGEGYSLLRGEDYLDADNDAVAYMEGRASVEEIHPDADGKAKAIIEV